ncbi:AraC family transcriptional regulator [Microlunatus parietis]|uniref:HTH araC/xylS-type domain-containing protein n=1 Tax=Microlunatus parietis TaxID=682979 RepID=A0A7Y9L9P0_9ACTN|nr:helix-turn-helix domain-containing protein [Microlunatus parietis]NYE68775.1 hypothetical protein [Microlunatus parietis]
MTPTRDRGARLPVEHRSSESAYIACVWRTTGARVAEEMLAIAESRWDLVFWEERGELCGSVVGPSARPRRVPIPDASETFGINFAFGTVLGQLPATRQVDGILRLPDVSRRKVRLAGTSWSLPTFDNAEAFVAGLVREEILVRDRLVAEVHRGATTDLSTRTVQRRFLSATGLPRSVARQIDRARNAAVRLEAGAAPAEVVAELDFYDHSHLVRALRRYLGRTPTQLRLGDHPEPLSLLYPT